MHRGSERLAHDNKSQLTMAASSSSHNVFQTVEEDHRLSVALAWSKLKLISVRDCRMHNGLPQYPLREDQDYEILLGHFQREGSLRYRANSSVFILFYLLIFS
jgi:hypothetical protein